MITDTNEALDLLDRAINDMKAPAEDIAQWGDNEYLAVASNLEEVRDYLVQIGF